MKVSIKYKLLFYMLVNVIFYVLLFSLASTFFVEKYYVNKKVKALIENQVRVREILKKYKTVDEDILYKLNESDEKKIRSFETIYVQNIEIERNGKYIFSRDRGVTISSSFSSSNLELNDIRVFRIDEDIIKNNENILKNSNREQKKIRIERSNPIKAFEFKYRTDIYTVLEEKDPVSHLKNYTLTLPYNNFIIKISTPLSYISENIALFNQLSIIIGGITIVLTVIWSFFISNKFTEPIKQMHRVTNKMSKLDFTETLDIKGNDEIFELSENINLLSNTLDNTISELNVKNKKLADDINREREIDKMRREFISNVSHELKTPIFLIQGYAEGLQKNISLGESKKNFYCDVICEETDKMDLLVKDLLALAKLESDASKLNLEKTELNWFIKCILKKYEFALKEKNISLTFDEEKGIFVNIDQIKIEQVMTNFINNALEHLNNNKIIKISIKANNSDVRVSVYNSGKNIEEENISKIWDSFYKTDKSRTRSLGGAGLGLSIVKAILNSHNADFGVINKNEGVEFWFELDILA